MYTITPIPAFNDNYIWAIGHPSSDTVVVVDPGEAHGVLTHLKENSLKLTAILLTHHHADHSGGIPELLKTGDVPVYASKRNDSSYGTHLLREDETADIPTLKLKLQVIEIPGHTLDHIAFVGEGMLFCGDTLFSAGCGRLFEGKPQQLFDSLNKLKALPDETAVYCGHEYTLANLAFAQTVEPHNADILSYQQKAQAKRDNGEPTLPSTIGLEKTVNPFLRSEENSIKEAVEAQTHQSLSDPVQVFAALRAWKDGF